MITKPTVLILGAGASIPYGFPSGVELKKQICEELKSGEKRDLIESYLNPTYMASTSSKIDNFISALFYSGKQSIDAFLEHRTEYTQIGKVAIGTILIPYEIENSLFVTTPSWYQDLFNNMNATFEEFGENKLAIITYNYDRSFEFYLKKALENSYGKSEQESIEQLNRIPIIHLHGTIGNLPGMGSYPREYKKKSSAMDLSICENTIKVIHESIDEQPQFTEAKRLIKEAETICFLGFGYDKTNMDRLSLKTSILSGRRVFGTAVHMGGAELTMIKAYFGSKIRIKLGESDETIEKFLRNHPVIVRPS